MNSEVERPDENSGNVAINSKPRAQVRKQLWLVLLGLFLVAIVYTGWRWYQGEYVVGDQPVPWRKADWSIVEQELDGGRRMAIFVAAIDDEAGNKSLLGRFETEQIRKQLFYGQRLPLKLHLPDDERLRKQVYEKLNVDMTPCCVVTRNKEPAVILAGRVTSEEIAAKMGN